MQNYILITTTVACLQTSQIHFYEEEGFQEYVDQIKQNAINKYKGDIEALLHNIIHFSAL